MGNVTESESDFASDLNPGNIIDSQSNGQQKAFFLKLPPAVALFFSGESLPEAIGVGEHAFWASFFGAFYSFSQRVDTLLYLSTPAFEVLCHEPHQLVENYKLLLCCTQIRFDQYHSEKLRESNSISKNLRNAGAGNERVELLGAARFIRTMLLLMHRIAKQEFRSNVISSDVYVEGSKALKRMVHSINQNTDFLHSLLDALRVAMHTEDLEVIKTLCETLQSLCVLQDNLQECRESDANSSTYNSLSVESSTAREFLIELLSAISLHSILITGNNASSMRALEVSALISSINLNASVSTDSFRDAFSFVWGSEKNRADDNNAHPGLVKRHGISESKQLSIEARTWIECLRTFVLLVSCVRDVLLELSQISPNARVCNECAKRLGAPRKALLFDQIRWSISYLQPLLPLGPRFLFALLGGNRRFRNFLVSRTDPEDFLLAILGSACNANERLDKARIASNNLSLQDMGAEVSAVNGGVASLLLFCEDWGFCEALERLTISSSIYSSASSSLQNALRLPSSIWNFGLSSAIILVLIRIVCTNSDPRLPFDLCRTALACIANLCRKRRNLDAREADRFVSMLDVLVRRLRRVQNGITTSRATETRHVLLMRDQNGLLELIELTMEIFCRLLRNGVESSRHLIYCLLHREELIVSIMVEDSFEQYPIRYRALATRLILLVRILSVRVARALKNASGSGTDILSADRVLDLVVSSIRPNELSALVNDLPEIQFAFHKYEDPFSTVSTPAQSPILNNRADILGQSILIDL